MGAFYCLSSAAGFGLMAIFAKLAYEQGVEVDALLVLRFGLAGLLLLALAVARGVFTGLSRRSVVVGLAMGAVGYASQAGLYFAALTRVDASQVALVFCTYPLLVMVVAVLTRREKASARRVVALGTALAGLTLVLSGAAAGSFNPIGALLSFGSAIVYTAYILIGDRIASDIPPLALTALVCAGGFGTFLVAALVRGGPDLGFAVAGWGWVSLLVLVSTVAAILFFFAGLARLGPTVTSVLGIFEPVVTVVSAAVVFREGLTLLQALGGAIVLIAVAVVRWPSKTRTAPSESRNLVTLHAPSPPLECKGSRQPGRRRSHLPTPAQWAESLPFRGIRILRSHLGN